MTQLGTFDQFTLDQAKKALAASQTDTDCASYPRHLGALEVSLANVIKLLDQLTGNA